MRSVFVGLTFFLALIGSRIAVSAVNSLIVDGIDERDEYYGRLGAKRTDKQHEIDILYQKLVHKYHYPVWDKDPEAHEKEMEAHHENMKGYPHGHYAPRTPEPTEPGLMNNPDRDHEEAIRLTKAHAVLRDHKLRAAYDAEGHDGVQAQLKKMNPNLKLTRSLPAKDEL